MEQEDFNDDNNFLLEEEVLIPPEKLSQRIDNQVKEWETAVRRSVWAPVLMVIAFQLIFLYISKRGKRIEADARRLSAMESEQ